MATTGQHEANWHQLTVTETFAQLNSTPDGLTEEEANHRLEAHGPNEIQSQHRISPWAILFEQFKNVLIIILLIATIASSLLGHGLEAIVIAVIVLFAVLLGFFQEYRAERAIDALREMTAPTAKVIRNGKELSIPARDLVPGDVILLHSGDKVPADSRLIEAVNLQAEEAALTGESVPVDKRIDPIPADQGASLGDRTNMVFGSTSVTYGRGRAVVTSTGMQTEVGKIATMLETVESSRTPLQNNLDRVGTVLARAAFAIVAIIVVIGLFRGQPFVEMLIFGIALAVAAVPEALPAVVTISLAIGVQRMVKRNALVRRLPAVETLGSTSVICSDKTGTLTKDEMTARKIYFDGQTVDVSGAGYEPSGRFSREGTEIEPPESLLELLRGAALSTDAEIVPGEVEGTWTVKGDPTEGALVVAAAKAGLDKAVLNKKFPRTQEIPFSSEAKRMTTLHAMDSGTTAYSKGAPEVILDSCAKVTSSGGEADLDEASRRTILENAREMAGNALRVLAVAKKVGTSLDQAERDMTFLGLVGMIDPPRPEAKTAVETCARAGIKVRMITGDHPLTGEAVARELGILENGQIVTGTELEEMDDTELGRKAEGIDVYARVSPAHKLRVVTALQQHGHIVAMTGDGVNDAPALKKADIGVAMGITGTDVTKEAAALTLTDDNFASIVSAVEEGRGIFENIKKYLMYLLSSNIGEVLLIFVASIAGLPLPLSAVQILYVNLATDGLPALALAVDPPGANLMVRAPRDPRIGIFTRPVVMLMVVGGIWSALANILLFQSALASGHSLPQAMAMTFVSLVIIQFLKAYNLRSDRNSILEEPFTNKWLNLAIVWELAILLLIIYVPFLQVAFGTYDFTLRDWLMVFIPALTISPVLEIVKWAVRKGWLGQTD